MRFKYHFLSLLFLLLIPGTLTLLKAQEVNCGDGIDNDGDGLIDCYDNECFSSPDCAEFYYGTDPECEALVPNTGISTIDSVWLSENLDNDSRTLPVIGDIDGDCVPEIVTLSESPSHVNIHNGVTGELEVQFSVPISNDNTYGGVAIGDINNDGLGEILLVNANKRIQAYTNTGTLLWTANSVLNKLSAHVHLADFDGDGFTEVYTEDQIFNGQTGVLILATGGNRASQGGNNSMPVAADVLDDASCPNCLGLELITDAEVYSIDIGTGTFNLELDVGAAITLPSSRGGEGFTSVADINGDGNLDVVVGGLYNCSAVCRGMVYAYTPQTGGMISTGFPLTNFINSNNTDRAGRPLLADLDGNGLVEIVVVGVNMMGALTNNFVEIWSRNDVNDGNSGLTSATAFDLDMDGKKEVIYRDELDLLIMDPTNGVTLASTPCYSQTRAEYPVISDVNMTGRANIICVCASGTGADNGPVTVFDDRNFEWGSARQVMNQHGYNPSFINDDLSIPISATILTPANTNNFLVQSSLIDESLNPISEPLTDMELSLSNIIPGSACETDSGQITITICNTGGMFFDEDTILVSLYNEDPAAVGTLIKNLGFSLNSNLSLNNVTCSSNSGSLPNTLCMELTTNISPGGYSLYAFVNDDGGGVAPNIHFDECDLTNNSAIISTPCALLPISEIQLTGSYENNSTQLEWEVVEGMDFSHFILEKSLDGTSFSDLFQTDASSGEQKYSGTDYNSLHDQAWYRVKGFDHNGSELKSNVFSLSGEEFIHAWEQNETIKIQLNSSSLDFPMKIQLIDIQGRIFYSQEVQEKRNLHEINVGLASGLYFLKISDQQRIVYQEKLLLRNK